MFVAGKIKYVPVVYISHDETDLKIIFEIAGVDKEDIKLEMTSSSVCLNASGKDVNYSGCYSLAHEIDPKKALAKFEKGLLTITIPLTKKFSGEIIKID